MRQMHPSGPWPRGCGTTGRAPIRMRGNILRLPSKMRSSRRVPMATESAHPAPSTAAVPAIGLGARAGAGSGAGGRVYRGRPGGNSLRGRGARCGAICRVGALGARGDHAVSQADRRRRAADAGARARSLPLGALGAGVLCQLPVPLRTASQPKRKARERVDCAVCVESRSRRVLPGRAGAKGERRPSDYHKVLLKRLRDVEARLHAELGEFESRCYVDTGPVVERSLAVAAGLGWAGKNTCLIHPQLGSFGFLAVLLTSLEVNPES